MPLWYADPLQPMQEERRVADEHMWRKVQHIEVRQTRTHQPACASGST